MEEVEYASVACTVVEYGRDGICLYNLHSGIIMEEFLQNISFSKILDMEKIYDNMDITKLTQLGIELDYPMVVLALGLQMHMALRGLQCYNAHPHEALPSNIIIARIAARIGIKCK